MSVSLSLKRVSALSAVLLIPFLAMCQISEFEARIDFGKRTSDVEEFKVGPESPTLTGKARVYADQITVDVENDTMVFRKLINLHRHCSDPVLHWAVQDKNGNTWEAYMNYKTEPSGQSVAYIHFDSELDTIVLVEQKQ